MFHIYSVIQQLYIIKLQDILHATGILKKIYFDEIYSKSIEGKITNKHSKPTNVQKVS